MMESRRGTGRFQWNTGAWFGSQAGCTCWMLFVGMSFLGKRQGRQPMGASAALPDPDEPEGYKMVSQFLPFCARLD